MTPLWLSQRQCQGAKHMPSQLPDCHMSLSCLLKLSLSSSCELAHQRSSCHRTGDTFFGNEFSDDDKIVSWSYLQVVSVFQQQSWRFGFKAFFSTHEHFLLRARRNIYHNLMIQSPRLAVASFHLWIPGLRLKRCRNCYLEADACSPILVICFRQWP